MKPRKQVLHHLWIGEEFFVRAIMRCHGKILFSLACYRPAVLLPWFCSSPFLLLLSSTLHLAEFK